MLALGLGNLLLGNRPRADDIAELLQDLDDRFLGALRLHRRLDQALEAALGRDMLDAAQLALFQMAGEDFMLLARDTRGTPRGAADAANSAISAGAQLIIGPLFATSAEAVAPQVRSRGLNMITFSNTRSVAGDGVFVMGFMPQAQVDRLVRFATSRQICLWRTCCAGRSRPWERVLTLERRRLGHPSRYPRG